MITESLFSFPPLPAPCALRVWATRSRASPPSAPWECCVFHRHVSISSGCCLVTCCKSLFSKHRARSVCVFVRGVSVRHDTRGVALLVCGFCPNSSQLQTAGDCSGNLIPSEPLQTLPTRLTCNLCLPVGERVVKGNGAQSQPACLITNH